MQERETCTHGSYRDTCAFRPNVGPCYVQPREYQDNEPRRQEHDCIMAEILGHSDFQR